MRWSVTGATTAGDCCRVVLATICAALAFASVGTAANESAGHFAVRVKTAELRRDWGRLWLLMHPAQQKFISRSLFVRCMSRYRNPRPQTIRVVSVQRRRASIPGVGAGVNVTTVTLRIDYGAVVPSQRVAVRETTVGSHWVWVNNASSRRAFIRLNFCG